MNMLSSVRKSVFNFSTYVVLMAASLSAGSMAQADSDVDTFIDATLNVVTNGTFIPLSEGEKEQIKLEYDKKIAEFERDLTRKSVNRQIRFLETKRDYTKTHLENLKALLDIQTQSVNKTKEITDGLTTIIQEMAKQKCTLEELATKSDTWVENNLFILETLSGKKTAEDAEALCADSSASESEKHLPCLWLPLLKTSIDVAKASRTESAQEQQGALVDVFKRVLAVRRQLVETKTKTSLDVQNDESELESIETQLTELRGQ